MSSKYINKSAKNNVNKSFRAMRNSSVVQPTVEAAPEVASMPVSVPSQSALIIKQPIYKPNNMNPNTINNLKQQDKKVHTLGNNFMVAANDSNKNHLIYTYNGIDWISSANGNEIFNGTVNTIVFNGILWVAGSNSTNKLGYSSDGINWSASNNGSSLFDSNVYTVAWNGQIWVAGGYGVSNRLAYSVDGINWTASINGNDIFSRVNSVAWNGSMWVAGGEDVLGYSYDGIN